MAWLNASSPFLVAQDSNNYASIFISPFFQILRDCKTVGVMQSLAHKRLQVNGLIPTLAGNQFSCVMKFCFPIKKNFPIKNF